MNSDARLSPLTDCRPEDVFIVGYPKSGNTWFQNLVAAVVYGIFPEFAPPALIHLDLIPDVHRTESYRRYATPMFFKSHHLPRPEYRRVVYVLRDGRDVMVSYFHHLQARGREPDFLEMIQTGRGLFPCKWHEHVQSWRNNPHKAEILLVKYEGLLRNPITELERFCQFIQLERSHAFLEAAVTSSSFAKLRNREEKMGRTGVTGQWQSGTFFFRRGIAGSHRDEMPEDVQNVFLKEAEPALRAAGYLDK